MIRVCWACGYAVIHDGHDDGVHDFHAECCPTCFDDDKRVEHCNLICPGGCGNCVLDVGHVRAPSQDEIAVGQ